VIVLGLALGVAEMKERREQDQACQRKLERAGKQPGFQEHQNRNEDVGHVIDDEIELVAREPGQPRRDMDHAGEGAVDAVDQEGEPEPGESAGIGSVQRRERRHEGADDSGSGEYMYGSGGEDAGAARGPFPALSRR
jgi:hypothetical protein